MSDTRQYNVITNTSVASFESFQDAGEWAAHINTDYEPYVITHENYQHNPWGYGWQGRNILHESNPDECVFCGNMKSFCICEEGV